MDGLQWKTLLKWMIWGYHYFRKQPYIMIYESPFENFCFAIWDSHILREPSSIRHGGHLSGKYRFALARWLASRSRRSCGSHWPGPPGGVFFHNSLEGWFVGRQIKRVIGVSNIWMESRGAWRSPSSHCSIWKSIFVLCPFICFIFSGGSLLPLFHGIHIHTHTL